FRIEAPFAGRARGTEFAAQVARCGETRHEFAPGHFAQAPARHELAGACPVKTAVRRFSFEHAPAIGPQASRSGKTPIYLELGMVTAAHPLREAPRACKGAAAMSELALPLSRYEAAELFALPRE